MPPPFPQRPSKVSKRRSHHVRVCCPPYVLQSLRLSKSFVHRLLHLGSSIYLRLMRRFRRHHEPPYRCCTIALYYPHYTQRLLWVYQRPTFICLNLCVSIFSPIVYLLLKTHPIATTVNHACVITLTCGALHMLEMSVSLNMLVPGHSLTTTVHIAQTKHTSSSNPNILEVCFRLSVFGALRQPSMLHPGETPQDSLTA